MSADTDTFESLCELVIDCPHFTPKWTDSGHIVLRNQNIKNGVLDLSSRSFTHKEDFKRRNKRATPKAGDIVFTREAPMGEVCMIPDGLECCLGQRQVLLRPKNDVCGRYLFWALQSPFVQHQISWNEGTGSTVSNVRIPVLKALNIPRRPKKEEEIAKLLSDLADKIELNRQTNKTLEDIAQAIFKSWFVDFDPTRAKVAAKEKGQDPELAAIAAIAGKSVDELDTLSDEQIDKLKNTAALFPDKLVESELGEIPQGWKVQSLDEIAHYQNGLALQKFRPEDNNEFLPVLKIAQLKKGFTDGAEKASPNIKAECIVNNGDVVFSWSGSLMIDVWCGGKVALNQHLFKVTSAQFPKWFYYYWTKRHLESFQQIAADKAVTMGHIKRSHLTEAKCCVPNIDTNNFKQIRLLLEKMIEQRLESTSLEQIRDALLPKLLSGELEVASAN